MLWNDQYFSKTYVLCLLHMHIFGFDHLRRHLHREIFTIFAHNVNSKLN